MIVINVSGSEYDEQEGSSTTVHSICSVGFSDSYIDNDLYPRKCIHVPGLNGPSPEIEITVVDVAINIEINNFCLNF